jgi:RimJ/RimL family protein N-acetyltransferase
LAPSAAVIEKERLLLREWTRGDIDDLARLLTDPEVMRYYPAPFTEEQVEAWLRWQLDSYRDHGHGLWKMLLRETGDFAGQCGLVVQGIEGTPEIEVGYHVLPHLWRRGLAAEAAAACRDYARDVLGICRLVAIVGPDNVPSQGVARKIGMELDRAFVRRDMSLLLFAMEL